MTLYDARKLARTLMSENMAGLVEDGWTFVFDHAKTRCGCCKFGPRTITVSRHYVARNDFDLVRNTILHEIAHAIAGRGVGHGPAWRQIAVHIGARPERCNSHAVMPTAKYAAKCDGCGVVHRRHRLTRSVRATARCRCRRGTTLVWKTSRATFAA